MVGLYFSAKLRKICVNLSALVEKMSKVFKN